MPLYDFKCETCERVEEMLLPSAGSSDTKLTCPDCETETMKRLIGLSNFQLKGGGWHKDGYQKKPKPKPIIDPSDGAELYPTGNVQYLYEKPKEKSEVEKK